MDFWQIVLLMVVGIFAGWLNVLAGGGSLLTVPVMLFMDIPAPVANGTNRIAILAQDITAVYTFFRRGFSDLKLSLSLSLAASLGAVAGAMIGVRLEGAWFDRILAAVMVIVMLLMATGKKTQAEDENDSQQEPKNIILGHVLMVAAGFWGGFIQVGVGFILMPILHKVMGFNLVRVNMYKVFIVLCYTIVALSIFATHLELLWWAGLGLATGNSIGGWYGTHTTIDKGEVWIKTVMYIALSCFIVRLLFF